MTIVIFVAIFIHLQPQLEAHVEFGVVIVSQGLREFVSQLEMAPRSYE